MSELLAPLKNGGLCYGLLQVALHGDTDCDDDDHDEDDNDDDDYDSLRL